jgi:hypothetical protein
MAQLMILSESYLGGFSAPHFLHFVSFMELNPLQAGHSQTSFSANGGTKPPLALVAPIKILSFSCFSVI